MYQRGTVERDITKSLNFLVRTSTSNELCYGLKDTIVKLHNKKREKRNR